MLVIPLMSKDHKYDALILVLGPDNLDRMKQADPAEVVMRQINQGDFRLVDPVIYLCYEEPSPELERLVRGRDPIAILDFLQRGWQYRPEAGDHDRGPERLGG